MPYITQSERRALSVQPLADCQPTTAGELQYAIARLITSYMRDGPLRYQVINDVIGALEGAKLEYYRCVAVPYENGKMAENGAVYHNTGGK